MVGPNVAQLITNLNQGCPYHWCRIVSILHRSAIPLKRGLYRGIGFESSILFAQEGAHVLLVDINLEGVQRVASLIAERYPNVGVLTARADVGKEADVKAAVAKAVEEFGRLDVMVRMAPSRGSRRLTIF
jgi:hypothetical protein